MLAQKPNQNHRDTEISEITEIMEKGGLEEVFASPAKVQAY
jgi:hypothetical protein